MEIPAKNQGPNPHWSREKDADIFPNKESNSIISPNASILRLAEKLVGLQKHFSKIQKYPVVIWFHKMYKIDLR